MMKHQNKRRAMTQQQKHTTRASSIVPLSPRRSVSQPKPTRHLELTSLEALPNERPHRGQVQIGLRRLGAVDGVVGELHAGRSADLQRRRHRCCRLVLLLSPPLVPARRVVGRQDVNDARRAGLRGEEGPDPHGHPNRGGDVPRAAFVFFGIVIAKAIIGVCRR